MTCLIVERTGDNPGKGKPAYSVVTRCGRAVRLPPSQRHPDDMTAWSSEVSCGDCRGER